MLNFILESIIFAPSLQAAIFIILIGFFVLQRRKYKFIGTGFSWRRTIFLLALFLYFAWNWATEIPPSLRAASVFGMFFINMHMIYNLILGKFNEDYQQALVAYGQDITSKPLLENVWKTGKKFIKTRYIFDALFSGHSPASFLKGVVSREIPADIERVLIKQGIHSQIITHYKLLAYLKMKLAKSPDLPQGLRDVLDQTIKAFESHAWIQEQVDEFLQLALKDPEKLYHAEWNGNPPELKPEK